MALVRALGSRRLFLRINTQHNLRYSSPVVTLGVGIEEPEIRDHVLDVIGCEHRVVGSCIRRNGVPVRS